MTDCAALAERVGRLNASFAERMAAEPTEVTPYPADFLRRGAIYHIACDGDYGPSLMTVGCVDPDFVVSLGGNPDGFYRLADRAGLLLDTADRRTRYVATFLDATKDLLRMTVFLDKFPDLRRTPATTPAEVERYDALREKYGPVVRPLALTPGSPPWQGRAFALVIWDLVQYDVALAADGRVTVKTIVLEKDLPLCLEL
jgi:hypothetical protein